MLLFEIINSDALIQIEPEVFLKLAVPFGWNNGPKMDKNKIQTLSNIQHWDTTPMLSVKQNLMGIFR